MGMAVNIPPVHHPLELAEEAATLDVLPHGRMDFAIGRGHPYTKVYEGYGMDREQARDMMEESL
jgi:alkanesulfonate monooxygenase SsuD/methylene tetrahydromethanopterin reductase-like flavin-dependent oxidoreductase (luciferase family)